MRRIKPPSPEDTNHVYDGPFDREIDGLEEILSSEVWRSGRSPKGYASWRDYDIARALTLYPFVDPTPGAETWDGFAKLNRVDEPKSRWRVIWDWFKL